MTSRSKLLVVLSALLGPSGCGDNHDNPSDARNSGSNDNPRDAATEHDAHEFLDAPPSTGDPHLRLSYSFEDSGTTVTDASTYAKHGTLTDASAWTANGRVGRGLHLTATTPASAYVTLPNGVLTGVGDFTISFWVKLDQVDAWARVYDFGNGLADPANRFMYFSVNGFIGANHGVMASSYGGAAANENALTSNTQLPAGVWKHVAVVGSGGQRTIYIDGFPAVTQSGPTVAPSEMEPLAPQSWLGKSRFDSDPGLAGTIDEFQIFDVAKAPAEVARLAWPKTDYSYWRFDEGAGTTTADSSDNAIPTALGTGVTWTAGRLGQAVDLAGGPGGATGPTVTLGTNPLAHCTTEMTIAAWIKPHSIDAWARVFNFGSGTTAFTYLVPSDGGHMHFAMVAPTGIYDLTSATVPFTADNAWHHVAVTVANDGTTTMYADGASVASSVSATVHPSDFASLTDLWLGKSTFASDPYFHGAIDDLRVGCRALTADEIKNLAAK